MTEPRREPDAYGLTSTFREKRGLPDDGVSGVPLKRAAARLSSKGLRGETAMTTDNPLAAAHPWRVALEGIARHSSDPGSRFVAREALATSEAAAPAGGTGEMVPPLEPITKTDRRGGRSAVTASPDRAGLLREAAQDALRVLTTLDGQSLDGGGYRGMVYVTVETWRLTVQPVIETLRAALAATGWTWNYGDCGTRAPIRTHGQRPTTSSWS